MAGAAIGPSLYNVRPRFSGRPLTCVNPRNQWPLLSWLCRNGGDSPMLARIQPHGDELGDEAPAAAARYRSSRLELGSPAPAPARDRHHRWCAAGWHSPKRPTRRQNQHASKSEARLSRELLASGRRPHNTRPALICRGRATGRAACRKRKQPRQATGTHQLH